MNRNPGPLYGMNEDFNGLGVFVYRARESGAFYIAGVFNRGMEFVRLNEEMLNVQNSCRVAGSVIGVEKMVRLELVGDKVTVSYGEKNNEVTTPCFTIQTPDLKY